MIFKRRVAAGGIGLLLLARPLCAAGDTSAGDPLDNLPTMLMQKFRPGVAIEQVVAQALMPIRQYDPDGNGLDRSDIDTAQAIDRAGRRANAIAEHMRHDLDGDLKVTEAELRKSLDFGRARYRQGDTQFAARRDAEIATFKAQDRDGDGFVTIAEMVEARNDDPSQNAVYNRLRQLLDVDPNGDGQLMPEELESAARAAFAVIDKDGDGVIDGAEYAAVRQDLEQIRAEANAPACPLPKVEGGAAVFTVGMYDGGAQPTVTVTGQDASTSLAKIFVEDGTSPLYLVLTSYTGMIWQFEGAVKRVRQVAVIPTSIHQDGQTWAGAGVVGVAKDLLTFLPPDSCGSDYYKPDSPEGRAFARHVSRALGARVQPLGVYAALGIKVPSGQSIAAQKGKDLVVVGHDSYFVADGQKPQMLKGGLSLEAQERWLAKAGGVVPVEPAAVAAPGRVEPYVVIPGQDGLRLLVDNGTLARTDQGYRLLKPLPRWPAGLGGSHAVTFILPKGIPLPAGSLGHSRLIRE
jgi:Ca2+-binding EF-hand superfamily protein